MDRGQGAFQSHRGAQFGQGQVGLGAHQRTQLPAVRGDDQGLAARAVMARGDIAGLAALLEELFDHAEGNVETPGHILPGALPGVVGGKDAGAQIKRKCGHARNITFCAKWLQFYLIRSSSSTPPAGR